MRVRIFCIIVCLLLSISLFRFVLGSEPLSFYVVLQEVSSWEYDASGIFDLVQYFSVDIFEKYEFWPATEETEWYEYIWYVVRILFVLVQIVYDVITTVVIAIYNVLKIIVMTIYDVLTLVFKIIGFV